MLLHPIPTRRTITDGFLQVFRLRDSRYVFVLVSPNLPCFEVSPDRYETMLGKPFRTRPAHIVTLGPV